MDRPLDSEYLRARRRRRIFVGGSALAVVAVLLIWGPSWIRPTISRSRIRTARVETGPIEAVITASGTVVPEVEEVISSPIDARVVRILARAGAVLAPGQPLVELDTTEARLAVERLAQNLALKENQRARTTLDLERSLNDLDSQARSKELQLQFYQSQLARNRQLSAEGLLSTEQLKLSELTEAQAVIELKRIESERANARQSNAAMLDGLALEMATLRNELEAARRQLELAAPRSDRNGVLTWTLTDEGATIRKGDVIARIADLSVVPRRRDRLRRARPPAERRPAGAGEGRRRHARRHRRHRAPDGPERHHHHAGRARRPLEPAPALQPARRRARHHRPQRPRAARQEGAVRRRRRRAAGVRRARERARSARRSSSGWPASTTSRSCRVSPPATR